MAAKRRTLSEVRDGASPSLQELLAGNLGELLNATVDDKANLRRYLWASRRGALMHQTEAQVGPTGKAEVLAMERPAVAGMVGASLLYALSELRALVSHEDLNAPETVHPEPSGRRAIEALVEIGASSDAAFRLRQELAARNRERVA